MEELDHKVMMLRQVQHQMHAAIIKKYIQAYHGEVVVIKYGGGAMTKTALKEDLAQDLSLLKQVGIKPVLVHGGGPEVSEMMKKMRLPVKFIDGYRQTSAAAIDIVKMVLAGKINKRLVSLINKFNSNAVGLSGEDGRLIIAKKKEEPPGLGYVGDVVHINTKLINSLLDLDYIPVIASVGTDDQGNSYNINADSVAAEVAAALQARHIIFLTNVDGLYRDLGDHTTLVSEITAGHIRRLIDKGEISGGMLPKMKACLRALDGDVSRVHILNGTKPHTILQEIFTRKGAGTMIKNDKIVAKQTVKHSGEIRV